MSVCLAANDFSRLKKSTRDAGTKDEIRLLHQLRSEPKMTMQNQPAGNNGPKLTYVDRPEVAEAYADFLETVVFDGTSIRMEFVVHRFDAANAQGAPSGRKVTAARLVLPISGAANLASQLEALLLALREEGSINEIMMIQSHGEMN
jgi:hypothetical protein